MNKKNYLVSGIVLTIVLIFAGSLALQKPIRENATPAGMKIAEVNEGNTPIKFDIPSGYIIKEVLFSSYGNPMINEEGMPEEGWCHADTWIKRECEGKRSCDNVKAHNDYWEDPCHGTGKKLMVAYTVGPAPPEPVAPPDDEDEDEDEDEDKEKEEDKKEPTGTPVPYTDPIFGIVFTDVNYAYAMYAGIAVGVLVIIGVIFTSTSQQPAPTYGMGRRRR